MYVDDATLFCKLDKIPEVNRHVVLNNSSCWLACNKLSLNVSKTNYIVFHTNHRKVSCSNFTINNTVFERVVNFNVIGL